MPVNIPEETHKNAVLFASGDTAVISGEIDDADPGLFLTPFFDKIKNQMDDVIRLDFTRLDFLNSSGIKCIVSFVMDKNPGTRVVFVTAPDKTWQKTSLEVIQSLDEDNISIESPWP